MVVLAVLIPLLMLGMVLLLGRYEELLLPRRTETEGDPGRPAPAATAHRPRTAAVTRPASAGAAVRPPAGTPAPSP